MATATVISQHVYHPGHHLGFFKNFILHKTAPNFTEISRKHVFAAYKSEYKNITKNRVLQVSQKM